MKDRQTTVQRNHLDNCLRHTGQLFELALSFEDHMLCSRSCTRILVSGSSVAPMSWIVSSLKISLPLEDKVPSFLSDPACKHFVKSSPTDRMSSSYAAPRNQHGFEAKVEIPLQGIAPNRQDVFSPRGSETLRARFNSCKAALTP